MKILKNINIKRGSIWVGLPVLVYLVAALFLTWPLARHIDRNALAGDDTFMMLRGAWAAKEAVLAGQNPMHQSLLAYPDGFTSYMMWSTPLRWVPGALLMLFFSPLVAFNLWLIATLVLNGTTAYWLGMELSDRHIPASLLGGLVFMSFPDMQGHLSAAHIDVLAMYALPLLALCLWRILYRDAGWRTAGWAVLWFALSCLGLTSQLIYDVMPPIGFMGLYYLIWDRKRVIRPGLPLRQQPWFKVAAVSALGCLALLIFFGPLMTPTGHKEVANLYETGRVRYVTDLLAFFSPSPSGPLGHLGLVPKFAHRAVEGNQTEGSAYLGIAAGTLVIFALARRRESRGWLVVALGAMILSLGPLLKMRGHLVVFHVENYRSYITLPWAALEDLPAVKSTRTPGRFNGTTALAWGALVSMGAGVALRKVRQPRVQGVVTAALGVIILLDYQTFWPIHVANVSQPSYFDQLAKMRDVRAVLNVPLDIPAGAVMEAMYQQTIHGKPMVGGQLFRRTPQNPAELAILNLATSDFKSNIAPESPGAQSLKMMLSSMNIDRVIVHKRYLPDVPQVMDNLTAVLGAPEYEDSRFASFVVPRTADVSTANLSTADLNIVDLSTARPSGGTLLWARGDNGWYDLSDPVTGRKLEFMQKNGEWYFFTPREVYGDLVFKTLPYGVPREVIARLDGHLITDWQAKNETVGLPVWLSPGFHTLRLEAARGCDPYPFDLVCLAQDPLLGQCGYGEYTSCVSVGFEPVAFTPEDTSPARALNPRNVPLDHGLYLRAYQIVQDSSPRALRVRLFWAADKPLPESYQLVVHLADPDTGRVLAQAADFPSILTPNWGSDSRWQSEVTIPLPDTLPAGAYTVSAGWLDPVTDRWLGVPGNPPSAPAEMVTLETVKIP